jgi:hypothetical protein
VRTLEFIAHAADGGAANDVISGHFSDEEAIALALHMYPDRPVVEVWEQGVLIARVGEGAPQADAPRTRGGLAGRAAWLVSLARARRDIFHRLHGEFVLAVGSGVLGAATVAAPRWVEAGVGLDVDRNSGVLEWTLTGVVMRWPPWRRCRPAGTTGGGSRNAAPARSPS